MKNKLVDVNDYLFEQLEKLNDDDLTSEQTEAVIKKADAVNKIANTIVKNGELQFKAMKMASDYGIINEKQVKLLLTTGNKNETETKRV